MISMGIDPSTSKTGLVVLRADAEGAAVFERDDLIKPKTTWSTLQKQEFMWGQIMARVDVIKPDAIAVEHYGLNFKNPGAVIPLVELGGVLRYRLRQEGHSYLSPTPAEVKLFATEKGNSKKDVMIATAKAMGYDAKTDDMADAFFLSLIGLSFNHQLRGLSQKQMEVIGQIKLHTPCK